MDVFPHILPRKYFDRLLAVAPPGPALQKRMSGFPMLVDLDLRFTMMDRWDGYVQVLTLANRNCTQDWKSSVHPSAQSERIGDIQSGFPTLDSEGRPRLR